MLFNSCHSGCQCSVSKSKDRCPDILWGDLGYCTLPSGRCKTPRMLGDYGRSGRHCTARLSATSISCSPAPPPAGEVLKGSSCGRIALAPFGPPKAKGCPVLFLAPRVVFLFRGNGQGITPGGKEFKPFSRFGTGVPMEKSGNPGFQKRRKNFPGLLGHTRPQRWFLEVGKTPQKAYKIPPPI